MTAVASRALGLGYVIWLRGRLHLVTAWVAVLALGLGVRLLPALTAPTELVRGLPMAPAVWLSTALVLPAVLLLDALTFGPIDLNASGSPFPAYARRLPMSTAALVGWPMLFGAVALVALWAATVTLVLTPSRVDAGMVLPACFLAACSTSVQAISWMPLPARFLRIPSLLVATASPIAVVSYVGFHPEHRGKAEIALLTWASLAYAIATLSLARARTGRELRLRMPDLAARTAGRERFRSAWWAQVWYESRRSAAMGRMFAWAALVPLAYELLAIVRPSAVPRLLIGPTLRLPLSSVLALLFVAVVPLTVTVCAGGASGRQDLFPRERIAPFFAIRPRSSAQMVADRLVGVVLTTAWMVSASAVLAVLALRPAGLHVPAAAALAFAFVLFRNLAADVWASLTRTQFAAGAIAVASACAILGAITLAAWLGLRPERKDLLLAIAKPAAAVLLAAKAVATVALVVRLRRRRLVSDRALAVSASLFTIVACAVSLSAAHYLGASWLVVASAIALVPCARLALAVHVLDRARHG